jgi:hypothetical protein
VADVRAAFTAQPAGALNRMYPFWAVAVTVTLSADVPVNDVAGWPGQV